MFPGPATVPSPAMVLGTVTVPGLARVSSPAANLGLTFNPLICFVCLFLCNLNMILEM